MKTLSAGFLLLNKISVSVSNKTDGLLVKGIGCVVFSDIAGIRVVHLFTNFRFIAKPIHMLRNVSLADSEQQNSNLRSLHLGRIIKKNDDHKDHRP